MKQHDNRFDSRPLILTAAIFLFLLALGLIFQDALREFLLVPVLYMVWVGELAFRSFEQFAIWQVTLLIALIISFVFAVRKARFNVKQSQANTYSRPLFRGRIQFWRNQIHNIRHSIYSARYRYHDLTQLIIKILIFREKSNRKDILSRLRSDELEMPPELQAIMRREETERAAFSQAGFLQKALQLFSIQNTHQAISPTLPDQRLEKVASYLENITEDSNGF